MPKKMKGGSKASQLVMETSQPKHCDDANSVVTEGEPIVGDVKNLSLYRTTGGGKKKARNNSKSKSKSNSKSRKRKSKSRKRKSKSRSRRRHYGLYGGSTASQLLMEQAKPKYCDAESPVIEGYQIQGSPNNLNNYYTTGGGAHPNINKLTDCNNGNQVGGSDWRSTVYSRGPVNTVNMNPDQFRMFTQHGQYIPQSSLRAGNFMKGGKSRKSRKSRNYRNTRNSKKFKKNNSAINAVRSDRKH